MYDFNNFVEYDNADLDNDHAVLVWSSKTGYFFTEYKNVEESQKIVAEKNNC